VTVPWIPPRKVCAMRLVERTSRRNAEKNPEEKVLIVNTPLN
jgi:hypothetical protein